MKETLLAQRKGRSVVQIARLLLRANEIGPQKVTEPKSDDPGHGASSVILIDGDQADLEALPDDLVERSRGAQLKFFTEFWSNYNLAERHVDRNVVDE